ncbi:MAG: ABC transporter permease, partial [Thermomicrobiales bacterium]
VMNWGFAGSISVLLLVVVLVVFVVYDKVLGLSTMTGEQSEKTIRSQGPARHIADGLLGFLGSVSDRLFALMPRARRREQQQGDSVPLRLAVVVILFFLSIPALLMIPISFAGKSELGWPPQGFSLQYYQEMLASPLWLSATIRSFVVGLFAALASMVIGTPVAFLLVRGRVRGKALLLGFVLSPLIIPRIIIAVGMFYFFSSVGLVGTSLGLILGHTVIATPYVVMTMMAVLRNYDVRLDQAAQSLGARPWQTLRHVTFPIIAAGLTSSFLFAFATSFDELTIALFSAGGLSSTLPKQFWDEVTLQVSPVIAAVSTCLFVFIGILITCADWLRRRTSV